MVDANKEIVQRLIERVWRQGKIDELPKFWTTDCINHADPSTENRGLEAVKRYHEGFASWFADFDDIEIVILQQISEVDSVATQVELRARHKSSGRLISMQTIRIDKIRDGKITEHWSVADTAGLMKQLA